MAVNMYIANPFITTATMIAFAYQAAATRASCGSNALSRTTLGLQALIFLVLAVLWPFRLVMPDMLRGDQFDELWEYYCLVGWPGINNAVVAVGQYVVLYMTAGKDDSARMAGERQVLLVT